MTVPASTPAPVAPPAHALVDPLTAPLGALLGDPLAADPTAPPAVTWPCVECGNANAMDLNACSVCTTPFGGRVTRLDVQVERRKRLMTALAVMGGFLLLLAIVTFAMTDTSGISEAPPGEVVIDYSTLPQEE